jgi:hypothetical protein
MAMGDSTGSNQQGGAYGGGGVQGGYGSGGGENGGGSRGSGGHMGGEAGGGRGRSPDSSDRSAGAPRTESVSQAVNNYIGQSEQNRNNWANSQFSYGRNNGISDAQTSALLGSDGYGYGELAGFNRAGPYDALGAVMSPSLVDGAYGFASLLSPALGLIGRVTDLGQKAYSNGLSSLTLGDALSVGAAAAPFSGIKNAGLIAQAALGANDIANGNPAAAVGRVGGLIGGQLMGRAGAEIGNHIGGRNGAIVGGVLGGQAGSFAGFGVGAGAIKGGNQTASNNSAANNSNSGGGRVTDSVYAGAPKVASAAPIASYTDYALPQAQLINPMEFI